MVCKERAEALVKTIRCLYFSFTFIIRVSGWPVFCSSVTITVLDEVVREKVLCIHTKLIIVCRRLREVKKMRDCSWSMFVVFAAGAKTVKMFHFARLWYHLKKSVSTWQFPVNKVIKFRPCWEAPYVWLVTYWQWHYRISWENGGRITKTPALRAGAPFPFPSFVLFSLLLSLPFLRLPSRLLSLVTRGENK